MAFLIPCGWMTRSSPVVTQCPGPVPITVLHTIVLLLLRIIAQLFCSQWVCLSGSCGGLWTIWEQETVSLLLLFSVPSTEPRTQAVKQVEWMIDFINEEDKSKGTCTSFSACTQYFPQVWDFCFIYLHLDFSMCKMELMQNSIPIMRPLIWRNPCRKMHMLTVKQFSRTESIKCLKLFLYFVRTKH